MKDFYYILGLNANCTLDEIKEAYRKLSKKFHPDLNQGDKYFENRFREIKEAYETLIDPGKRIQYDAELKKSKSDPTGDTYKKQQYYREQAAYQHYQARSSSFHRPKTKGPGTGMTIILILIALIIGVYMVESFSSSKARKVTTTSVVSSVPLKIHKHRRRKHSLENKISGDSSKLKPAITSVTPVKPAPVRNKQFVESNNNQPRVVNNKQPAPAVNKSENQNFLYATYVRPNITGVINMRKFNDYGSAVIERIPANSKVFVIEKGDTYYKVSFNNDVGYVPKWSLQLK
jgi:curved DNA-binding protein CbpA